MIDKFISKNNLPDYRVEQFNKHFYQESVNIFDNFISWPKDLREKLKKEFEFSTLKSLAEVRSKDGKTKKLLFKRKKDGQKIESVLMQHKDGRNTVCVSCMVGCPVGCDFCATGKMGFGGNLSAREIVDQILYFQRKLLRKDQKVTNIVFMGMGEPLLNLKEVLKAVDIITDEKKMGMSQRRITISTAGYVPGIKKLIERDYKGRLAISLHAPNQQIRQQIMRSIAMANPMEDLFEVLDQFAAITNKRITYEYIMIKDLNDQPKHAYQLSRLLRRRLSHVNLIPYNHVDGLQFERSSREAIENFSSILEEQGINHTIRVAMGADVNAACGQLITVEGNK